MVQLQNIRNDERQDTNNISKQMEQLFHSYIIKIIEGAILIVPLLLLKNYEIKYNTDGYMVLSNTLIIIFFVSVLWLIFNVIKAVNKLLK